MAILQFSIPDPEVQRVIDAICSRMGYSYNALPAETEAQFARRQMAIHLKDWIRMLEQDNARAAITEINVEDQT